VQQVDLYVDGVDEISSDGAILKGGGGALLREKIIASNSKQRIYIADSSKLVTTLGKFPLPVEVVQFGHSFTARRIEKLGARTSLRAFVTDSGNFIYDCKFDNIPDPVALDQQLHQIPGVVETGLFLDLGGMLITVANGRVIERQA
jgi:ribose 5-phosphate isomerase A